jgi:hypothetical protein
MASALLGPDGAVDVCLKVEAQKEEEVGSLNSLVRVPPYPRRLDSRQTWGRFSCRGRLPMITIAIGSSSHNCECSDSHGHTGACLASDLAR